jgi:hypothetical protein
MSEGVVVKGNYVVINNKATIKIDDIVSFKPQSIVMANPRTGKIISRDFAKIIVRTTHELLEFLFTDDARRDAVLQELNEAVMLYQSNKAAPKSDEKITINVSDSSNVNIVSGSSNVSITADNKKTINKLVNEIKEAVKTIDISDAQKSDIVECAEDIQERVEENKEVKKFSIKNLIGLTSDLSQISSLAIQIGQILGYIPH